MDFPLDFQADPERYIPRIDLGDKVEQLQVNLRDLPPGSTLQVRTACLLYTIERFSEGIKIWGGIDHSGGYRGSVDSIISGSNLDQRGILTLGKPAVFPYFRYDDKDNTLPDDGGWVDTVLALHLRVPDGSASSNK